MTDQYPGSSTGGYQCTNCGAWVLPNEYHVCAQKEYSTVTITWPPQPKDPHDRIIALLEQILAALDRLERK